MKQLLIILSVFISCASLAQPRLPMKQLGLKWFNIEDYGAVGNDLTDNTTAIQNAMNAAAAVKGVVYIPEGTFRTGTITWNPDVELKGANAKGSILKSNSAVTLLKFEPTSGYYGNLQLPAGMSDFTLDGNSVGTIGLSLSSLFNASFSRIHVKNFTQRAVNLLGCVGLHFYSCYFSTAPVLVYGDNNSTLSATYVPSNLVIFNQCLFISGSSWAFDWYDAAGVTFNACDFELNGTAGNLNTGVGRMGNMAANNEGVGLLINGGWAERNNGTAFLFNVSAGTTRHIFRDFLIQFPEDAAAVGIKVIQTGTDTQSVYLSGVTIKEHSTGVITDGTKARTAVQESFVNSHSEVNSGVYYTYAGASQWTDVTGGIRYNNNVYLGTGGGYLTGDAGGGIYMATGPVGNPYYILVGASYKANISSDGLSINNGATLNAAGVGLNVGTGSVVFGGLASTTTANTLYYNTTTKEVTYGAAPSGGSSQWTTVSTGLDYTNNANGTRLVQMINTDVGASSQSVFLASNGTASTSYGVTGTGYTTYGALEASNARIYSGWPIVLMADGATSPIKLAGGGNAETIRIITDTEKYINFSGSSGATGYGLRFTAGGAFEYKNSGGSWAAPTGNALYTVTGDVTNSTTTLADATGLSFTVVSGTNYRFSATVLYTAALVGTGARITITGPATPTYFSFRSLIPNAATTMLITNGAAYDLPAAAAANSAFAAGNTATITGMIRPSANGTVKIQFASETASSSITIKAGSTLEVW